MPDIEVMEEEVQEGNNDDLSVMSDDELDKALSEDTDDTAALLDDDDVKEGEEVPDGNNDQSGKNDETPGDETTHEGEKEEVDNSPESLVMKLEEERDKFKKMNENAQELIIKQAAEVGDLRTHVKDIQTGQPINQDEFNEKFMDDPYGAVNELLNRKQKDKDYIAASNIQQERENKDFILESYPDFESFIPDIISLGKQDGIPDEYLDNYKKNPYANSSDISIQYLKRAQLLRDNNKVQDELQALKDKLAQVPDKIAQAANGRGKTLAKQTSNLQKDGHGAVTEEEIPNMTESEIAAYLESNKD